MSEQEPVSRRRLPLLIGVLVTIVVAVLVVAVIVERASSGNALAPPPSTPTPSVIASATPLPQLSFADCSTAHFGPALAPLNPPTDVHVYSAPPAMTIDTTKLYLATITTARGKITVCLQPALAPNTVNNFVTLDRNHFYDGLVFHRVGKAGDSSTPQVIQGGDPQGTGQGGPGYSFNDEPVRQSYVPGTIAMANSGPNTNGSQFFIDTGDNSTTFQPSYNLFGKVMTGLDVAMAINKGDSITSITVQQQQ